MTAEQAFRRRVAELCKKQGIVVEQLGLNGKVSFELLHSLKEDTNRDASIEEIEEICIALNVSVQELFDSELFLDLDPV